MKDSALARHIAVSIAQEVKDAANKSEELKNFAAMEHLDAAYFSLLEAANMLDED